MESICVAELRNAKFDSLIVCILQAIKGKCGEGGGETDNRQ